MAAHVDPLVVGRVKKIGEVLDLFVPTVPMSVRFGTKDLTNGCEIKPSIAVDAPAVQIAGRANDLFTVLMVDPDAPSPSEPSLREWLHWLVVNIPGGADPSQGEGVTVVPYVGPRPPVGIHRYVLVLYQQKAILPTPPVQQAPPGVADHAMRACFTTRAFAARHGLGSPVAAMYFNAQKEPANRRRNY